MSLIPRLIVILISNGIGLYLSTRYIPGFIVPVDFEGLLIASSVLTAINLLIRPIIKLILSPLILLTLGLASIFVNLATLYLLDYLLLSVTISGILPLFLATLVLGGINLILHITTKTT